jgi:hypothetical protein
MKRVSKNLRDSARGQSCVMCGKQDETIVLAHRNVPGSFGMGMKGPDWWGAHLCAACHYDGDHEKRRDYQWWELAVYRTMKRWIASGLVTVEGLK